ncbi:DUF1990 domain-containing protein [Cryobacterium sp. TMT1-21]|uniref:DUF1990 domain-containing protein n=1 Tax=Cryobacterium shii TaxID=1259235 RepID=A0AAQ2C987_9MICO|nr:MULTISPECIES: DUF1990 domain-containing protein [Cryobacterium]TFC53308.1 DUF1990 domain-containing protein [Cryobacterium shii]TFC84395.1 DUF1990 domain-containing protein [Cryobacterium sp. TmT2-59]TFD08697.1 DUF1990 domain-containing protein [Cryobacterium sp. TMT1-21]TFD18487.1 DUF1990 domain-containing protein [Cryobacterium sp. TMT4-10]TFD26270.1 DUF1990 domain-containing protein [Cryobacterium sp. TMT2-23]
MRRATFTDTAVTYASIGGTLAPDLLRYPPKGYRPIVRSVRLGSGADRFQLASKSLMTWGLQRGSGMTVTDLQGGTGEQYTGLVFGADGQAVRDQKQPADEATFAEDGTPYIVNGMSAHLSVKVGPFTIDAPVRVVYVVDEPDQVGFAYGTMAGHPESGEESFIVDHREDDSVWLTIRAFSRPSTWFYRLGAPVLRLQQAKFTKRYLRALHPIGGA